MRVPRVGWLLVASVGFITFEAAGAEPPVGAAQVVEIDPVGMPPGAIHKPDSAMYFLWHEDGVWHLRNQSKGPRRFDGEIRVRGGKITKFALVVVEARKKELRKADYARTNRGGTRVDFSFATKGGSDGFDFKVAGDQAALDFNLRIDGTAAPDRIAIGRKGSPPPGAKFTLPASPKPSDEAAS